MNKYRKASAIYLALVMAFSYGMGALELVLRNGVCYDIMAKGFTFAPVLAALIAKKLTGTGGGHLSLRVWRRPKEWAAGALAPGILIALGAAAYYLAFPDNYSGIFALDRLIEGAEPIEIGNPAGFAAVCVIIAAVFIPVQLLELGEEIGWRGYLLLMQAERYGVPGAVVINGLEWGAAHLPLIYFGFNYSLENPGAPWSNMAMMLLVCLVCGTLFSYITLRTGNCMFAAIMHGAVNIAGELPVLCSARGESGLLGPNPTGLVGMAFLMLAAAAILIKIATHKEAAE